MASNFSGVIPGRASTRSLCMAAGALTTITAWNCDGSPVSNSSGMSSSTALAPEFSASAMNFARSLPTSGWISRSSRASASGLPTTWAESFSRSTTPFFVVPGNSASISGAASPA